MRDRPTTIELGFEEVAMRLLWEWWLQIWPNLAASVISLPPAFVWHHRRIKTHISRATSGVKQ